MNPKAMVLGVPRFQRGSGLGNRLFIWARCRVWCQEHQGQPISPIWFRPAIGQALRRLPQLSRQSGAIDLFNPTLLGCFQATAGDLPWWQGLGPGLGRRRISETQLTAGQAPAGRHLVLFDQPTYSFDRLNPHWRQLHQDLEAITRPRHRRRVAALPPSLIGLHVRCGDGFRPPPAAADNFGWVGWLQQTPISWFAETLQQLRALLGSPVPALLVSDGSVAQLEPLLALPQVHLLRPTNAIVDLLALARCRLILGSGSSSFSAWAAFLGQTHALTAPGHPFTRWGLEPQCGQVVAAHNPRDRPCSLPPPLLRDLADRLPSAGRPG